VENDLLERDHISPLDSESPLYELRFLVGRHVRRRIDPATAALPNHTERTLAELLLQRVLADVRTSDILPVQRRSRCRRGGEDALDLLIGLERPKPELFVRPLRAYSWRCMFDCCRHRWNRRSQGPTRSCGLDRRDIRDVGADRDGRMIRRLRAFERCLWWWWRSKRQCGAVRRGSIRLPTT
jgi:hypothetical protein